MLTYLGSHKDLIADVLYLSCCSLLMLLSLQVARYCVPETRPGTWTIIHHRVTSADVIEKDAAIFLLTGVNMAILMFTA